MEGSRRNANLEAVALLLACAAITASATESPAAVLEVPAGTTVYFQLADSTPGKPGPVIRVEQPNRDYGLVKASFEVAVDGTGKLTIRNGYEDTVALALNEGCPPQPKPHVLLLVRPGIEVPVTVASSTRKVVLCEISLMSQKMMSFDSAAAIEKMRDHAGSR